MNLCHRCHLRTDLCLCEQAPQLSQDSQALQLMLLTHPDEPRKRTNTGRLLEASLSGCLLWFWQRREFDLRLVEYVTQRSLQPVLLFPATENAEASTAARFSSCDIQLERQVFILLDATWQQAEKMLRQSPELQRCPRLALQPSQSSVFNLRRNQRPGSVSSVESGIELLRVCGLREDAQLLVDYFQRFLQHSEAHRSGYTLDGMRKGLF